MPLDFTAGLQEILARAAALPGMWTGAHVRLLGLGNPASPAGDHLATIGCHIQFSPLMNRPYVKERARDPRLIEAFLEMPDVQALLEDWLASRDTNLWGFRPPELTGGMWWNPDATEDPTYQLLEDLPAHMSRYRIARLAGSGQSWQDGTFNYLVGVANEMMGTHTTTDQWAATFMGLRMWRMESPYILIQMPAGVGVDAASESDSGSVRTTVHFREPLRPDDFEIRSGAAHWDASTVPATPILVADDAAGGDEGWHTAVADVSASAGETTKIWVTRRGSSNPFDWSVSVDRGEPDTLASRRRRFLTGWYGLANQSVADHMRRRPAMMTKGSKNAPQFELALANIFGALGYEILMGGTGLSTPGVDFMAFREDQARVYAVSATISNDVGEKLMEWVRAEADVRTALEPLWTVVPLIISADPSSTFRDEAVSEAKRRHVWLLGEESLAGFTEDPPDFRDFANIVQS